MANEVIINPRYLTYTKAEVQALLDKVNTLASFATLISYAVCSTAANVAAKTVAIADYALPENGGCVHLKMTNANTSNSPVTLNINATGAKPLYYNGSAVSAANTWESGEVIELYYDGIRYQSSNTQGIKYEVVTPTQVAEMDDPTYS